MIAGLGRKIMLDFVILIADDDTEFCSALKRIIQKRIENSLVYIAENGVEAYKIFCREEPHVVLLDVMMPVQNGWDACAMMRREEEEHPKRHKSAIFIISCIGHSLNQTNAPLFGADEAWDKPLKAKALIKRLRQIKEAIQTV